MTPLSVGVADSKRTPVRKAMPRFLKARSSAVLTAGSSAATSRGGPSTIVTSAPNERMTEANSTPMTPPPSTTMLLGTSVSARAPSLVMIGPPSSSPAGSAMSRYKGTTWRLIEAPVADDDGALTLEAALALDVVDLA